METLWQLEANIDDMNPQNMEYVFSLILLRAPMMSGPCR